MLTIPISLCTSGIEELTSRKDVVQKLQKYHKVVVINGINKFQFWFPFCTTIPSRKVSFFPHSRIQLEEDRTDQLEIPTTPTKGLEIPPTQLQSLCVSKCSFG
uniref:Putative ovule protein n=1 Tax=Solanum chacoense TaxID=4108 RepID=A0A0V0HD30_SOLCH